VVQRQLGELVVLGKQLISRISLLALGEDLAADERLVRSEQRWFSFWPETGQQCSWMDGSCSDLKFVPPRSLI
jgi:hypothetical protein